MFKVKATVIGFLKDEKRYPCHFRYKVGDVITYDGETIAGRVCPSIMPNLAKAFNELFASGGRHREGEAAGSYFPFWHSPLSLYDPAYKKYDGVGFKPTLARADEDYVYAPDETLFDNPPQGRYFIGAGTEKKTITVTCGDHHTLAQLEVAAYDLADRGDALPYFRRAMTMLARVAAHPGTKLEDVPTLFTKEEIEDIYPYLGRKINAVLVGELELVGYVTVADGKATATGAGRRKVKEFTASLTDEERAALKL
jgi:uncharacterized repeat protein (TIGR04076 family)